MKYVTEGIAEALYKRRINESVDEGKDWSGFKVRYTYAGDSLSDYEATCIVKAKDEKEAVKIAMKKVNADAARNFRIDGKIDSYAQYKKDFPNSGFDVFESSEVEGDITEALKVVKSGKVQIKKAFTVKEFDEDDGWVEIKIKPGTYKYQVIDFRGWKPRQLEVDGKWVDVAGDCVELEELLGDSKIDGSKKIVEARQSLKGGITAHKVKKGMKLVGNRKYIENHDESDIYNITDVSDLGKGEIMIKYSKLGVGNSSKVFDEDDVVGFLIKEGVEEAATYSTDKKSDKKSDKQRKAAELAIKNLIFKMDECEIASNQFSYAHLSNDKMAELMSEVDPKYDYEVEVHTEPSKRFGKITHHIMMRVKK